MKKSLTLLFLTYSLFAFGQNLSDEFFWQASLAPCPFDSSQQILQYNHWLIYQTLDDRWDGPVDSSICIELAELGSTNFEIRLDQIEPGRPLFIKSRLDDQNKILLSSNTLYNPGAWYSIRGNATLDLSTNCSGNFCTGMIVGIDIPDESGNGRALRINDAPFVVNSYDQSGFCLITEYFPDNYIREFVLKFSFDSIGDDAALFMTAVYMEEQPDLNTISKVEASNAYFDGSAYQIPLIDFSQGSFSSNMVLLYDSMTYPSVSAPSYVEASPLPNTSQQEVMNLYIEIFETLTPQPFTYFRGRLIEGSDSLRHSVNVINNGGDLCLPALIDLVFDEGTRYVHQGGNIGFVNHFSCIQFLNGGTLEVADNTDLHLGNQGNGVLALRQGGSIEIGKNSSLTIDAQLLMNESRGVHEPHQIYMTLNRGSQLSFTENARLSNYGSIDGTMKLNIYMNGGILDDSQLSAEEKNLINLIYPTSIGTLDERIELFPNPAYQNCSLALLFDRQDQIRLDIHDLYGRLLYTHQEVRDQGHQLIDLPLKDLIDGIYWLRVQYGEEQTTRQLNIHKP